MPQITTTAQALAGGVSSTAGTGQDTTVAFTGTWATGDEYTLTLTDGTSAVQFSYGAGTVTGLQPTFAFTFNNKVYFLSGPSVYFSTENLSTQFNDILSQLPTDGFVTMSNQYSAPENLTSIAPYQGRLAFFSRQTTQIWQVSANPANWVLAQTMANIGSLAPQSVQAVGDLDVLFLSDTGIRSLRVRDSSLNAFVDDIGSPIDQLIQNAIIADANGGVGACGTVEPSSQRYWLYLNGKIYVLSNFPSSKVKAWSTYDCTGYLASVLTTFVPQKFVVLKGRVYALVTNGGNTYVLLYGGTNNNTYDATTITAQTPFMDGGAPGNMKESKALALMMTGKWKLTGTMDIYNQLSVKVLEQNTPTTEHNTFGWSDRGSHASITATCSDASYSVLSSLIWFYSIEEQLV